MMSRGSLLAVVTLAFHFSASGASAEDKNNLRLSVSKRTIEQAGGKAYYSSHTVDRTMALKASIQNIGMGKIFPEGKITSVVLLRSWVSGEAGSLMRYTNETKLEPLKTSQQAEVSVGEYHIGGHMHGTSDQHVDQVAAWKITIDHDGKLTEFFSSPAFDSLNKRAREVVRPR